MPLHWWVRVGSISILTLGALTVAGSVSVIEGAENFNSGSYFLPELKFETSTTQSSVIARPAQGELIATMEIPRLKRIVRVFEGTTSKDLKNGAGHFVLSVLPGYADNSVIAGHRDSVFSQFGSLKIGDSIIVQTNYGKFTYEIKRFRIVGATDRTVIVPTKHAQLTLSTCYPFRFIGNAPQRFIVIAALKTGVLKG
jgi:sortase A